MNKSKKKQNLRVKGNLRLFLILPALMSLLLIAVNVWIYITNKRAGRFLLIFVVIYILMVTFLFAYSRAQIMRDLVDFATQYGLVQNTLIKELGIPYGLFMADGQALWMNDLFKKVVGSKLKSQMPISRYMPELNANIFPQEENVIEKIEVHFGDRIYNAEIRRISVKGFGENERLIHFSENAEHLIAIHLYDVTELSSYIRANEDQQLVAGLIYIDNYDELLGSVEEVRQSLLMALVDRKINQYMASADGIVKKIESDKYFVVMKKKKNFKALEEDKFSILEEVKGVNVGNKIPATLSLGLGLSGSNYTQSYDYSRVAIDLALARGGDQAVIKDNKGITYFGGKREQTAKNTRVKARVKAEALREFITVKDDIFIMGHKMTDVDSFGAAIGLYRAVAALEKTAYVVVDEISASLRPLFEIFDNNPDYPKDMFITPEEAIDMADSKSLVIVVDTNRPQMTECPELLQISKTIVVLDHHRQSSDNIDNALLSYIEPYASSACEMVSEILQYIVDNIKIPNVEASAMYAGIMIDTNNFTNRTGVRTFEAAAFLRRNGADITLIRKMFRDDMGSYRAKAEIVRNAEVYRDKFAIATGSNLQVESPTIIGAQAANELLDISQIKASFVLTEYAGKIYVSARAIDEVNVQVIMEHLDGGGHMNAAGAQLTDMTLAQGVAKIKELIDKLIS
ncbi:DHH family phosphoesterase [Ohessyouella blattaphilus]|uniref:Cyclic-di-AMP phosphodiesterase n=1 Tax=Ohessyouella blattaphilus TaxID=2949333 RepID=A0ABT1EHV8_9FIRM|nr:DHH family phosphoesterase [Ohessyouella blattaphilus]MCP1110285.1 DHH family phosphoesterase [Ohessyouella blattaphilus]MCR8563679.1 DHH family phosphoesterase [Ohessyouella blattaphilus]